MPSMKSEDVYLGELEQLLLLIVLRLGDEAYANPIGERAGEASAGRRHCARRPLYRARTARSQRAACDRRWASRCPSGAGAPPLLHGDADRPARAPQLAARAPGAVGRPRIEAGARHDSRVHRAAGVRRTPARARGGGRRRTATISSAISTNRSTPLAAAALVGLRAVLVSRCRRLRLAVTRSCSAPVPRPPRKRSPSWIAWRWSVRFARPLAAQAAADDGDRRR